MYMYNINVMYRHRRFGLDDLLYSCSLGSQPCNWVVTGTGSGIDLSVYNVMTLYVRIRTGSRANIHEYLAA